MTVTIGRRELLAALGGAAALGPLAASAQEPGPHLSPRGPGSDRLSAVTGRARILR